MRALFLGGLVLSTFILGCSGTDSTNTSTSGGGGGPASDPNEITFQTGEFEIPAGDSLTCFYTNQKTAMELSVNGATGHQGPGGHHILAFWTDTPRAPEHHPCSNEEMLTWHQFAGAAEGSEGAEGIIALPDGLATRVPEGKQIVIQSHYINTTGKSEKVNDTISVHTVDPADVKAYANYFVIADTSFDVPPNGALQRTTRCDVPQDLANVLYFGHMHEFGTHYKLETVDDDGNQLSLLYSRKWEANYTNHPSIDHFPMNDPFKLAKGTHLQQTCDWVNSTPEPLTFPREMCVGFFYYFPDNGELSCDAKLVP